MILDTYKAILKCSCPLNPIIRSVYFEFLSSQRIVMMSVFHRAKVVWFRLAHVPMVKNDRILFPLVYLF